LNTERARRHRRPVEPARRGLCFIEEGGGGNSSSSASTTNIDQRVVGGDGSTNISLQSGNTVTLTDGGSVQASFGFARDALKGAFDFATGSATKSQQVLASALEGVAKSSENVADAYKTSKAGEQKVLVAVGVLIAGVVGIAALRGLKHG